MIVLPVKSKVHGEHFIFIDGEDFDKVKDYKWCVHKRCGILYAETNIKGKTVIMHRLLLGFPKGIIDHKNGIGLDNRRENTRLCTRTENNRNRKKQQYVSSSLYKGVHQRKKSKKYVARIIYNKNSIYLGDFENEHDAGEAYNKKAVELFGEFAHLNIIKGETTC